MFVYELSGCGFESSCSHLILTSFNESKVVQSYVLIPTVNRLTRLARNTASPIDYNITNSVINAKFKTGIIKTDISDHLPIFFIFICIADRNKAREESIYKRNYSDLFRSSKLSLIKGKILAFG